MTLAGRKILFVSQTAGFPGGIERYLYSAAQILRKQGAELWGCFSEQGRDAERFLEGFDHTVSSPEELPHMDFDLAALHKTDDETLIRTLLRRFPNRLTVFVHDHDDYCPRRHKYYPVGRINCHSAYHRFSCGICSMAASPRAWKNGAFAELSEKFISFPRRFRLLRQAEQFIVLSDFMKQNLILNGFPAEKIHTIPPCVPLPPEPARPENKIPLLLSAGQLIRGKGVDQLLKILPHLRNPWELKILGEGNDRPMLEQMTRDLGLEKRVHFLGWSLHPETVFAQADLAVFPFRWQEPFGLVAAESAAQGLPVVAFRLGGVTESVIDGQTGFLAGEKNLMQFAELTDRLLADPGLRKQFGDAGRNLVASKFSRENFLNQIIQRMKKTSDRS